MRAKGNWCTLKSNVSGKKKFGNSYFNRDYSDARHESTRLGVRRFLTWVNLIDHLHLRIPELLKLLLLLLQLSSMHHLLRRCLLHSLRVFLHFLCLIHAHFFVGLVPIYFIASKRVTLGGGWGLRTTQDKTRQLRKKKSERSDKTRQDRIRKENTPFGCLSKRARNTDRQTAPDLVVKRENEKTNRLYLVFVLKSFFFLGLSVSF
jgi:hypothetical protein